jgi:HEAT repeat protein
VKSDREKWRLLQLSIKQSDEAAVRGALQDEQLTRFALNALGDLRAGSGNGGDLLPYLKSDDGQLRSAAIRALGKIRDPQASESLLQLARSEPHDGARSSALLAYAMINGARAESVLMEGLSDDAWQVRFAAVEGLGLYGRPSAIDVIKQAKKKEKRFRRGYVGRRYYNRAIRRIKVRNTK